MPTRPAPVMTCRDAKKVVRPPMTAVNGVSRFIR
ncbi:Uncharacterised protein [Mycobacteroides abscessus subsp. abscessus]|nr:Uncharacterised protein [Mycobacteroides abscessus subsp. abscessus]